MKTSRSVATPTSIASSGTFSFGAWTLHSLSMPNPVASVGRPRATRPGVDRQRPARAHEQRTGADDLLERVAGELNRRSVRRRERGSGGVLDRDLELRALGKPVAHETLERGADLLRLLAGREPDRHVRSRLDREHGLHEIGRAARDPVHVERRVRERAQVERRRQRRARSASLRSARAARHPTEAAPRPRAPRRTAVSRPPAARPAGTRRRRGRRSRARSSARASR